MKCRAISHLLQGNLPYISIRRTLYRTVKMAEADVTNKKPAFGNRFLTDPKNVFEHNAWDNVVWDDEQEREALRKTQEQLSNPASEQDREKYLRDASYSWDQFYQVHEHKFFKDRQWLFTEFPELAPEFYLTEEELSKLNSSDLATSQGVIKESDLIKVKGKELDTEIRKSSETEFGKIKEQPGENNFTAIPQCDENKCDITQEKLGKDKVENERTTCEDRFENDSKNCCSQTNDKVNLSGNYTDQVQNRYSGESKKYRIFEVGCGAGNTVFPILQTNNDPDLMVYCCDFSSVAVDIVKENKDFDSERCHAFVCDVSDPEAALPMPESSLDVIVMIFVFSAIPPERMQSTLNRLAKLLKPGGFILLRDYGRYDLAQLRFKNGRCLSENFYSRGDGTLVYFFTQDELREMMTKAGLLEKQNYLDRRLQVNRGRQIKMYRVWVQCKYMKPKETEQSGVDCLK